MTVRPSDRTDRPPGSRPCPVCGGLNRRVLHRQRFVDGPLGDGYDVVVCRGCGTGFADGIPAQAELDAYYAERSKYTYDHAGGAESPYDFRRFELIADQVVPFLSSPKARILDVGCATGGLLAVLMRRGYANVVGADPSPACAAAARRLHDVDVRMAALAQLADWENRFDLILMVGVLEHLRDVRPAVEKVVRLLTPNGMLYCAQPDAVAFADCVNAPYQQFSVEHVNFFSEASLNHLLATSSLASRRTWRWMVEWREGVTDSVVSGIYSPVAKEPGSKSQVSRVQPLTTVAPQLSSSVTPQLRRSVPPAAPSLPTAVPLISNSVRPQVGSSVPSADVSRSKFQVPGSRPSSPSSALKSSFFHLESEHAAACDRETEPALERYLAKCREDDAKFLSAIDALVRKQEPVLIWGAGTLTRRLLASTRLADANIVAFVDSNPAVQGHKLAGRAILAPAQITDHRETIVICSVAFEREIVALIRNQLRLPNQIVTL